MAGVSEVTRSLVKAFNRKYIIQALYKFLVSGLFNSSKDYLNMLRVLLLPTVLPINGNRPKVQ
ncbi:MAG: hypothetical protein R2744_00165 [Bacteroidales bacterium]